MFIAIDGNSTGKIIESLILENRLDELADFSKEIQKRIGDIGKFILEHEGIIIMAGGDNILAEMPLSNCHDLINKGQLLAIGKYHFSVAMSPTVQGAYMGLKYAKATGNGKIEVTFLMNGEMTFHVH